MRGALAILFAAAAAAGPPVGEPEPDAAIAEAARWVEPRGCASGSFRSKALPVVTEIEEAWQLAFEAIEAPPVHWDGIGYVVARVGSKTRLVAFDLATGKERAHVLLSGFLKDSPLLVWDHLAMLQPGEDRICGYRLLGKSLVATWIFRGTGGASPRLPVVHENEVYCLLGGDLARIRPGSSVPSWTSPAMPGAGRPVVCGPYVFLAAFGEPKEGRLSNGQTGMFADLEAKAYRRSDGRVMGSRNVAFARADDARPPRLDLTLAGSSLYVGSNLPFITTAGTDSHCIVKTELGPDRVSFGEATFWDCRVQPAHHPRVGTLVLSAPRRDRVGLEWSADREGKFYRIALESEQPDLFVDQVAPTVLGDVVYFGSWAADMVTNEILWRLPVKHVTYSAVPADGLVLVVDEGKTLVAFRGRGRK